MKTLYLVRHAKASREAIFNSDLERTLLDKGIDRAFRVSSELKKKGILPEKIISSHAKRAFETAILFTKSLGIPMNQIEVSKEIYEKPAGDLLEFIRQRNNSYSSLMLFGHNQGFTDLFNFLSETPTEHLNTSSCACLQFNTGEWQMLNRHEGKVLFIERGK